MISTNSKSRPLVILVSPFLDKRHGTERIVAEWISRIADSFEIHVYSQRIEDVDLRTINWHRIPKLPGPHLLNYLWWFVANHIWRSWDQRVRGIRADIVYSPGVNCLDADVVSVHVVFADYVQSVAAELRLGTHPVSQWPQLLHRKIYYHLISFLERRIYGDPSNTLVSIAQRTASALDRYYRRSSCPVIYAGIDLAVFNPQRRASLRNKVRAELKYPDERFVLLLIGNHWANKGLPTLLQALESLRELPIDVLVIGREDSEEYQRQIRAKRLEGRVQFKPLRVDVEYYYAAADAYVGPSLEDAFALPPAEAMSCGLPVIVSATMGASEIITNGVDGLILEDARDARSLAAMIETLFRDEELRKAMASRAAETSQKHTWERNAREFSAVLEAVLRKKSRAPSDTVVERS